MTLDELGTNDIFTASSGGTTRFTIGNDGTLTIPSYAGQNAVLFANPVTGVIGTATTGSSSLCLLSGGSTPSWGSCSGSGTASPFNSVEGDDCAECCDAGFSAWRDVDR